MKFKGKDISAVYCRGNSIKEVRCKGRLIWPNGNPTIACDGGLDYVGEKGTFEHTINFGTATGYAGIAYNAWGQPDRFTIEWNGQTFTSGFVGDYTTYDQQLIDLGFTLEEINTGGTGKGILYFNKTAASPNTAKITIEAPLEGTAWNLVGICPQVEIPNAADYSEIRIEPELHVISHENGILTLGWGVISKFPYEGILGFYQGDIYDAELSEHPIEQGQTLISIPVPQDSFYWGELEIKNQTWYLEDSSSIFNLPSNVEILTPTEGQIFTEGETITLTSQITAL